MPERVLSFDEAVGSSVDPQTARDLALMKPHLALLNVEYWGYDGVLHRGQLLVNKAIAEEMRWIFVQILRLRFPLKSVIPQSQFGYNDERSMQANNSSAYRPGRLASGRLSEHDKGAAVDLKTLTHPMDVTHDDGRREMQLAGAKYDPSAPGAVRKDSDLRRLFTSRDYEWGGNWGDPQADPPVDFYKAGYFDYQHFQFNAQKMETMKLSLPDGV